MSIETSSVGGIVTNSPVSQSTGSLQPIATASNATNLASFQANNPRLTGQVQRYVLDTGIDLDHPFFEDANGDGISDKIVASQDFHGEGTEHRILMDMERTSRIAMSSDTSLPGSRRGKCCQFKFWVDGGFLKCEAGLQWVISNASALNITSVNLSLGDGSNPI